MQQLTSQQVLENLNNITVNDKGAISFKSTTNPITDLFTETRKLFTNNIPEDELRKNFHEILNKVQQAKNFDSELFVKLLKFHRLIEKGNGMKMVYYICMLVLKDEDPVLYEAILKWSYEYPKDILRLNRMSSMLGNMSNVANSTVSLNMTLSYLTNLKGQKGKLGKKMTKWALTEKKSGHLISSGSPSNPEQIVEVSTELELYSQLVVDTIKKIITGKMFDDCVNPMLFKYLSYETGHFAVETKIIWKRVEEILKKDELILTAQQEYKNTSTSVIEENTETSFALTIKRNLEKLIFKYDTIKLSNKICRNIKKLINQQVNLTDNMFRGYYNDGLQIGTLGNDVKEVNLLSQILKKTPTLSFKKAEKTIKKWMENKTDNEISYPSKKHQLIIMAYKKYLEDVAAKKVEVKTRGLNLVEKCWDYWRSNTYDIIIEEQINKASEELKELVKTSFNDTYTFEMFSNSLIPVLDISGSMEGTAIQTGLFYLLMLVKVFGVQIVHFFSDFDIHTNINQDYNNNLELIRQIYRNTEGSTNLDSIFRYLNNTKTNNKNLLIITDSDCDPHNYSGFGGKNPFHEISRLDRETSRYPDVKDCNVIVVNVKVNNLSFPYLNIDPKVCYLTGNNPKTLNGFIKALCESVKNNTMITPESILKYSLALEELNLNYNVPKYNKVLTERDVNLFYEVLKNNLAPSKKTL